MNLSFNLFLMKRLFLSRHLLWMSFFLSINSSMWLWMIESIFVHNSRIFAIGLHWIESSIIALVEIYNFVQSGSPPDVNLNIIVFIFSQICDARTRISVNLKILVIFKNTTFVRGSLIETSLSHNLTKTSNTLKLWPGDSWVNYISKCLYNKLHIKYRINVPVSVSPSLTS